MIICTEDGVQLENTITKLLCDRRARTMVKMQRGYSGCELMRLVKGKVGDDRDPRMTLQASGGSPRGLTETFRRRRGGGPQPRYLRKISGS